MAVTIELSRKQFLRRFFSVSSLRTQKKWVSKYGVYYADRSREKRLQDLHCGKVAYGMGDVACNVVFALTSGLVVYFYTNVIGISAGLVGTILLISRIFDGISDLAMAQVMDKVHSKHGKGRVWVLWMAIPYGLTAIALFAVPAGATTWVQAIYIFHHL